MNRGSNRIAVGLRRVVPASMRPRFMNGGSGAKSDQEGFRAGEASMRPRFMNRGSEYATVSGRVFGSWLQ